MHPQLIVLFLATLFSVFGSSAAASAADWRSRSIYQIVTDRFSRSDGSYTSPCDTNARQYCGGTWRGIINKLDYIQNMGFTAIWISPIIKQLPNNTYEGEPYHGYWPENLYALNSNFGTEQDLIDLITACHSRGMYLMLDIVINHFASMGETPNYEAFVPFSHERFFHPPCPIDWGNQTSIENCWMGDGFVSLPDINTEDPVVVDTWKKYLVSLVDKYKIDGLRLDACRNIPKSVSGEISRAANVYSQGEVWDRDPNIICPYQEYMDGMHNYPFKELATDAFVSSTGNLTDFVTVVHQMQAQCKDVTLFGTFMENHDNPRLGSFTTDIARLKSLAVLNILTDGIPVVYYGQELALTGSNDPMNREALWLTGYSTNNTLVPTFTALNAFRNFLVMSGVQFITTLATYTVVSSSVIRVQKGNVVIVLTNSGKDVVTNTVVDGFGEGMELVEVLTCGVLQADDAGRVQISLTGDPMVLYPKSLMTRSRIC
ncbi:Alpha-amylase [Mycena sanguinolenta]|uniref:alpha-amylase n=1 Tax=Mycena sanguinolenta TaxID=230812 RepID=A0A8H6YUQ4_9AGAR|nr:Alpha-amylase [Mycena sanguinolenta]